jgi:hypothetical protein
MDSSKRRTIIEIIMDKWHYEKTNLGYLEPKMGRQSAHEKFAKHGGLGAKS